MVNKFKNSTLLLQALGENALLNCGNSLPIVIIRPSIVVAAWQEPLPGWIDNFNGPTAVIANTGKGVLRSVYCK
jgi:fatty acyl-CoA reductase